MDEIYSQYVELEQIGVKVQQRFPFNKRQTMPELRSIIRFHRAPARTRTNGEIQGGLKAHWGP